MAQLKKDDFEARDYQVRLADMAIERNKIIYLPTGSGKTFISTMVISHFLQKNNCATKKLGEGGKRAFFLVNTVALVQQQTNQIGNRIPFTIKGYSGDMGVDYWTTEIWDNEIANHSILVMTAQIFLNLILDSVMTLKEVAIVVFDECHHAVVDHPMRQIMQQFQYVPANNQPRVLGLTATLLNRNVAVNKVDDEIRILETTFLAQIATADDENMVKMYSTNPAEFKVEYRDNAQNGRACNVRDKCFNGLTHFIKKIQIDDKLKHADSSFKPKGTFQIDDRSKSTNKELKNVLADIQKNMDDLGLYGGNVGVFSRLIQLQKLIYHCESPVSQASFSVFNTQLLYLRKFFDIEMREKTEKDRITYYSSDKLHKLLGILKKLKDGDSAIVFVRRRFTAKIMHNVVSACAKADPKLSHIKCDFIVGYNVSNPFKDTRENLLQRVYNDRVLGKFNSGLLNVLFGSNVVEEGMDIQNCNIVIMFDEPLDFRSYTQSKGRARHSTSRYIIMYSNPRYAETYKKFQQVEERLQSLLCGGMYKYRDSPSSEDADATLFANIPGLEPYKPWGNSGPTITALSAISHVNRYFLSLKMDKFTRITPYWFIEEVNTGTERKMKCHLQLPLESKVRGMVEGTLQSNKENAKRSVALEACKRLHEAGELDNKHLLPVTIQSQTTDSISLLPHWDSEEDFKQGSKKRKRLWSKAWPECFTGCMPKAGIQVYLHVLQLKALYSPPPDNHRLIKFHEFLTAPVTYAIVSSKPLLKVAPFPLYMSTGTVEVTVMKEIVRSFNEVELKKISTYHGIIFKHVAGVVNDFLIRDFTNGQNSYLIAPVIVDADYVEVDWDAIKEANKPFPSASVRPTDQQRKSLKVNDANYLGMIVTPWYRSVTPSQKFIVTKVCHDMSESSEFPSDNYQTYKEYFIDKYKITPLISQPLLEVRALSSRMNNLKPLSLTKTLRRRNNDENEDFEVWLVPEFCHVYPVAGTYWIKALLLPSVLHRVTRLCAAEELRVRVVGDTGIGIATYPPGYNLRTLEADASLAKQLPMEVTQLLTPLSIQMKAQVLEEKKNLGAWDPQEEPLDIERDMDTITVFDIFYYDHFVQKPLFNSESKKNVFTQENRKPIQKFVKPPPLNMLQKNVSSSGPEQVQVLQALTVANANDLINCERLETLGDSFLKFAVSLVLFEKKIEMYEGVLTCLKGQIVGNKNLYFCGRDKNMGSILEVKEFSPRVEWIPPQFGVEHTVKGTIVNAELDPALLYNITIPEEEIAAGKISDATRTKIGEILLNAQDLDQVQTCTFTDQLALSDKNVADAVEATIGVYLENSGLFGALGVMNWFGVMDPELATEDVFVANMSTATRGSLGTPRDHLVQPELLEEILHYEFRDKAYMLQALTHPSYNKNNITPNYQRLEFLGDALIDLLITIHIYERCTELHPGDLTDLRSALVNNITLGCLTVRHGLQRFLLHRSSALGTIMSRFVKHQEERKHLIDNDILFLIEENEVNIAETVEVPKALGDVFEALVGAIYLDSGKNLDEAWRVIYNLMKDEIEKFHSDVPKNHVRMLYESNCGPIFNSSMADGGVVMVKVEVLHDGKVMTCHGFGDNKQQAKRAAAKQALRKIRGQVAAQAVNNC